MIIGNHSLKIVRIKEQLKHIFEIINLGRIPKYLGVQFVYLENIGILIIQQEYSMEVLKQFKISNYKPYHILIIEGVRLSKEMEIDIVDPTNCRQLVKKLIHLTITCLDVVYVVGVVSRYMSEP